MYAVATIISNSVATCWNWSAPLHAEQRESLPGFRAAAAGRRSAAQRNSWRQVCQSQFYRRVRCRAGVWASRRAMLRFHRFARAGCGRRLGDLSAAFQRSAAARRRNGPSGWVQGQPRINRSSDVQRLSSTTSSASAGPSPWRRAPITTVRRPGGLVPGQPGPRRSGSRRCRARAGFGETRHRAITGTDRNRVQL